MNLKNAADKVMKSIATYQPEKTAVFYELGKLKIRHSHRGKFRDTVDFGGGGFIGIYTSAVERADVKSDLAEYFDEVAQ